MAFNELEERISKIRQQNEEIKRRYEEVEEDKKNAAKLNALVQMVPSTDWPERKEPPEYSNPPKITHKQKSVTKEQSDQFQYHYPNDRRKGAGPPSDPKYNFLADSERDEHGTTNMRDNSGNKNHNRSVRGNFKKRGTGREGQQRGRMYHGTHRDEHKPEYEAWRKERNRIDEDRISRQKTAEGNWRREWDNDKAYLVNDVSKGEGKMSSGDFTKKDHKDGRHLDGNGYTSHNRGAYHKSYRGSSRNYHNNHDYHHMNSYDQHNHDLSSMNSTSVSADERTVIATDKSIKVTLNQSTISQGPVMSVKVNSPSIAGTGRVGPRQRTRVTYSSNSDVEVNTYESGSFSRQKSFDDKNKANHFANTQKTSILRRPQSQKKKENEAKSPYMQKKEYKKENSSVNPSKHYENGSQQNFVRKDYKDTQKFHYPSKSPRASHKKMKMSGAATLSDDATNECSVSTEKTIVESDTVVESQEVNTESPNTEVKINESSVVAKEKLKTDERSNEVIIEHSEGLQCNPETINENDEELNYDANVSFTTNEGNANSCENENTDEKTKKDDPIPISHMDDVDNDVERATNEKDEISDSNITVDKITVDSYTSDNNKCNLDTVAQVEEMKTELVKEQTELDQETKLAQKIESVQETKSVQETELVQEIESVQETEAVEETKSVQETELVQEMELIKEAESIQETESVQKSELVQEIELIQKPNLVQETESVEKTELVQESKLVKENELVHTAELVKENELIKQAELIRNQITAEDLNKNNEQNDITRTTSENRSEINVETPSEELAVNTCLIVKEDETTCHDNKVPVKENILPVDDTNNKCAVKNSEDSLPKCVDEMSESSPVNKVEDNNETVDKILETAELQNKDVQPAVDAKHGGSENAQSNSESKEE